MTKSVEQIVSRAKSHFKKGQYSEAEALYAAVIMSFPNNSKAKQGLQSLKGISTTFNSAVPPQATVSTLMGQFNQKMLGPVVNQAQNLLRYYPKAIVLWNILGIASAQLSHFDQAIQAFEKIISISPDQASAYYNLGNVFRDKEQFNDAIDAYTRALELKPDYEEAYNNLSITITSKEKAPAKQQLDVIEKYHKSQAALKANATKHFELGVNLQNKAKLVDAVNAYRKATDLWPKFAEAYFKMGNALYQQGNSEAAIEAYSEAICIEPNFDAAYHNLGVALTGFSFNQPNQRVESQLEYILDVKSMARPMRLAQAALSLVKSKSQIKNLLLPTLNLQFEHTFSETINELSRNTLLLKLMSVCPITEIDFENLLNRLRVYILQNISKLDSSENLLKFQSALALQCYTNEYIYELSQHEAKAINELEITAKNALANNSQPNPNVVLCLASYRALHEFDWSDQLKNQPYIEDVLKRQLTEPAEEKVIKTKIQTLSKIKDEVSLLVREQYEENPYPRWVNLGARYKPAKISQLVEEIGLQLSNDDILSVASPQILIAGCGTGQHSIEAASKYENSSVLAIDLSRNSLAYAKRKSLEFDVQNIEYKQGDILEIGKLNRQFDIIECFGVLHHMNDPLKGWTKLVDCLKPGGLMGIGLYSELGRQPIVYYRNKIQKTGMATSTQNIKSLRAQIMNESDEFNKQIRSWSDFYSLSELRDLIFHTQEHRFTLQQIKSSLRQLRLSFCGFDAKDILGEFKLVHPEKNSEFNLDNWSTFEEKNPRTFSGMYQFWCQKPK